MGWMERLRRIDDRVVPERDVTDVPEPLRRASERPYLVSVLTAVAFGTVVALLWTLSDYGFQWNNFVLRMLLVGCIAFGLVAVTLAGISRTVDTADEVRDLRSRGEQHTRDGE